MSKTITKKNLHRIAQIIRDWPVNKNIKWDLLCAASELELGYIPTRQALSNKPMVSSAFKIRKEFERNRFASLEGVSVPKSMPDAVEQILNLRRRVLFLESEIASMQEIAALFIYNASLNGLSKRALMQSPLKLSRKE